MESNAPLSDASESGGAVRAVVSESDGVVSATVEESNRLRAELGPLRLGNDEPLAVGDETPSHLDDDGHTSGATTTPRRLLRSGSRRVSHVPAPRKRPATDSKRTVKRARTDTAAVVGEGHISESQKQTSSGGHQQHIEKFFGKSDSGSLQVLVADGAVRKVPQRTATVADERIVAEDWPDLRCGDVGVEEETDLRKFDLNVKFGPCIGLSRIRRWHRAEALGLQPPRSVLDVLYSAYPAQSGTAAECKGEKDCKDASYASSSTRRTAVSSSSAAISDRSILERHLLQPQPL